MVQRNTAPGTEPNLATYNKIKTYIASSAYISRQSGFPTTCLPLSVEGTDQIVEIIYGDLNDFEQVRSLFDKALDAFPNKEVHILVNCAGIQRRSPAVDFPEKEWDEVSPSPLFRLHDALSPFLAKFPVI